MNELIMMSYVCPAGLDVLRYFFVSGGGENSIKMNVSEKKKLLWSVLTPSCKDHNAYNCK